MDSHSSACYETFSSERRRTHTWWPISKNIVQQLNHPQKWVFKIEFTVHHDLDDVKIAYGKYNPFAGWTLTIDWTNTLSENSQFVTQFPPCTDCHIQNDQLNIACLFCGINLYTTHIKNVLSIKIDNVCEIWNHMENEHCTKLTSFGVGELFDNQPFALDIIRAPSNETVSVCYLLSA
jgi:hypothetical protein